MGSLYWQLETLSHLSSCRVDPKAVMSTKLWTTLREGPHYYPNSPTTRCELLPMPTYFFVNEFPFSSLYTHINKKNPSIRGHGLKNVQTFLAAKFECGTFRFFFFDAVSTTTTITHQFHNTKMKKKLPFPPYYYCCQVQKNCDTL